MSKMKTERIEQLRKQYLTYNPAADMQHALVMTEVFKKTEGEPMVIRRAKALKAYCEQKIINILPGEMLVGSSGRQPRAVCFSPEFSTGWIYEELDTMSTRPQDPYQITEEEKKVFKEKIYPYWNGKCLVDTWKKHIPPATLAIGYGTAIIDGSLKITSGPGEISPGYEHILFKKGYGGIKAQAQKKLDESDWADPANVDKFPFWQAVVICCEGMEIYGKRHAAAARELAAKETGPNRKAELEQTAEACEWTASNPPRTFFEALQLIWSTQAILFIEGNGPSYSPGRVDQYLWPYYQKDLKADIMTKEQAQEYLEMLWIKMAEQIWIQTEDSAKFFAGYMPFQNLCCGGVDKEGNDTVNELSYMVLQATMDVQLFQPSLSVRLNKKNPPEFFRKVAELVRLGTGFPAIHNDDVGMRIIQKKGIPLEDARDWSLVGCVEPAVSGKLSQWSSTAHYCLGSVVEFALFNGYHLKSGKQLGLATGDAVNFTTYKEFENVVKLQLENMLRHVAIFGIITERLHQDLVPMPLISCLIDDCIERGKDLTHGGAIYYAGPGSNGIGLADMVDSMAAVKRLVYEEKKISMTDLLTALRADFEGFEEMRQMLINKAPKWGNDNPYVDSISEDIVQFIVDKHHDFKMLLGSEMMPSLYPVSSNVPHGATVCALPSGRKAYTPLADGISPSSGRDKWGPTAILKSLDKAHGDMVDGGTLLNLKFDPSVLEGEEGLDRFTFLLKAFLDCNIYHMQCNVVRAETLRDAQVHPENYGSMLIRVAGYSAYFVELAKETQDDIINRTCHMAI